MRYLCHPGGLHPLYLCFAASPDGHSSPGSWCTPACRAVRDISGEVHIAVSPLDRLLNVGTVCFDSFEGPCLAFRIGKEAAQFSAVTTLTGKHARPAPVIWRHQRFGNPGAQVLKTGIMQPLNGRLAGHRRASQVPHRRDQNGVQVIRLAPRQHVTCRFLGQSRINPAESVQEFNDEARFHAPILPP